MRKNQTTKLKIDQEINHPKTAKSTMPFIECTCGVKILLIPDVAAMSRAVINHLKEHKDADEEFLIKQILKVASKQVHI